MHTKLTINKLILIIPLEAHFSHLISMSQRYLIFRGA